MRHDRDVRSARADQALVPTPTNRVAGVMNMHLVDLGHGTARGEVGPRFDAGNCERRFAIPYLNQIVAALSHVRRALAVGAEHEVNGFPAPGMRSMVELRAVYSIDDDQLTASVHRGDCVMPAVGTHNEHRGLLAGPQQRFLDVRS